MRFEKFTQKLQAALQQAQSLAIGRDHTSISPIHIMAALLEDESNISVCQQAGASIPALKNGVAKALEDEAVIANPTGEVNLNAESVRILNLADRQAQKAGDEYIATEWVMLILAEQGDTKKIFKEAGVTSEKLKAVIEQLRGEQTVDSQNAEDQ